MKPILLSLALLAPQVSPAGGIDRAERQAIETELRGPVALNLKNGVTMEGHPVRVSETHVKLATAKGASEVIFTFAHDQIESIEIPGESYKHLAMEWMESGESEKALELMGLLFQQRKTLLDLMPASESHFFVLYIQLILDSPDPGYAIGVSTLLRPNIKSPAALRALDDAVLESYQRLELFDEAVPLAKAFIAKRSPYGESALGYYVLGCEQLRQDEYDQALELALQPIVFASLFPKDKLAHCYALAVSAALEMRKPDDAVRLFREMQARGFAWPDRDTTLTPYLKQIETHITEHETD